MKAELLILCWAMVFSLTTHAGVIYSSFANGGLIPDGSAVGSGGTATASGFGSSISDVSVSLNISGGYNGDLYAYLSYGGVLVPLLNRVGVTSGNAFGNGETGFAVTLSSAGAYDVHSYGIHSPSYNGSGQLTGTWQPDGRAIDPQSSPGAFDTASRVNFGAYHNMNPNGIWTLFIADLSSGEQSRLVDWSLEITAVPEPVNVALGIFAGVAMAASLVRRGRG